MKITGRSVTFAFAGAAIAAVGLAAPATADSTQVTTTAGATVTVHHRGDGTKAPAELGNPSEWGVVTFKMDASPGTVQPMSEACISPSSGGTWCYGWYSTTSGGTIMKKCYSNYAQQTKGHSSTAKIGNGSSYDHAAAGDTSNASRIAGFAYTCSTYYSVD